MEGERGAVTSEIVLLRLNTTEELSSFFSLFLCKWLNLCIYFAGQLSTEGKKLEAKPE